MFADFKQFKEVSEKSINNLIEDIKTVINDKKLVILQMTERDFEIEMDGAVCKGEPGMRLVVYIDKYEPGYVHIRSRLTNASMLVRFRDIYGMELKEENPLYNFGEAIHQLQMGKIVTRSGWNGKGMYIYLVPGQSYKAITEIAKKEFGEWVPYEPYFAMRNAQGRVSMWHPSVSDCLAEDWMVVE